MDHSEQLSEWLREDDLTVLSRITGPAGNKTMLKVSPASRSVEAIVEARFEHELSLVDQLSSAWAARPIALARHEGRPALLLDDAGGGSLEKLLGQTDNLDHFLTIAINISRALGQLHDHGLIHKDLRPANILVDEANQVRLTGFGLASRVPKERHRPVALQGISGNLAYMAPEQTGRMSRSIDLRTDLYGLGVCLYELLVAALPFSAVDPQELMYCHVARAPPPPSFRLEGIPTAVDAILLKLLAKNAEDRYQTAAGLEHDLQLCLDVLRTDGALENVDLGLQDISQRLSVSEKLYGRELALDQLHGAFRQVAEGGSFGAVFVSGAPGIGKSSTVHELRSKLEGYRALFVEAKFEHSNQDVPFSVLAQAFKPVLLQILSYDDASLKWWRNHIGIALGTSAQLIIDVIPDLALVIGEAEPPSKIAAEEEKARFHLIVRQFIAAFARPDHPLILFLDDLHLFDTATLELFEWICTHEEIPNFLLIGAYRTIENVTPTNLAKLLAGIASASGAASEIRLLPLAPDNVRELIADTMQTERSAVSQLSKIVYRKTLGNPLFVIQLLLSLEAEGLVEFDLVSRSWSWDIDGIRKYHASQNVAELMVTRLLRSSETELKVIKQLACFGAGASTQVLSQSLSITDDAVDSALHDLIVANLISRDDGRYLFLHDHIQETAYSLIPVSDRVAMHAAAGELLARGFDYTKPDDRLFEVVSQFNRGAKAIQCPSQRLKIAEMNLIAGKRAKAATAFDTAILYLAAGCNFMPDQVPDNWRRIAFELEFHLADCRFVVGDIEAAERALVSLAESPQTISDLAQVVGKQMTLYTYLGQIDDARTLALHCLKDMGVLIDAEPSDSDVKLEYQRLTENIGMRTIESLRDLPVLVNREVLDAMELLAELLGPAGVLNSNLLDLVLLRMANLSLEKGICDASCHAFGNIGARVIGWRFGNFAMAHQFGRLALSLIEDRGLDRYASRVYAINSGVVAPWSAPLRDAFEIAFRAINMPRERGGITYSGYAWVCGLTALLDSGKNLEDVQRLIDAGLKSIKQSKFALALELINSHACLVRGLREDGFSASNFAGKSIDQEEYEASLRRPTHLWHARLRYSIRKLQFLVFFGFYTECSDLIDTVERDYGPLPVLGQSPVFEIVEFCFFSGLARASALARSPSFKTNEAYASLLASHAQLAQWSEQCPANFSCRAKLLAAEIANLNSQELESQHLYEESIRLAQEHGFTQVEALSNERASDYYEQRKLSAIAETYRQNAYNLYQRWGATAKARELERSYPHLRVNRGGLHLPTSAGTSLQSLDLNVVAEMYQALSQEIVLERLIERLMVTVLETAGAVRGLLLLPRGDEMRIVAEANTGDDTVSVDVLPRSHPARGLPRSIINFAVHSRQSVILDDAADPNPYSGDEYFVSSHPRSILCLPLLKQMRLVGLLYLENNLASHIFTPERLSILQLLASQAAISIENAELFRDIQEAQAQARKSAEDLRRSFDMIPALAWRASSEGLLEFANQQWHEFTGVDPTDVRGQAWHKFFHAEDVAKATEKWRQLVEFGTAGEFEARMQSHDGEVRRFLIRATPLRDARGTIINWHGTNTDIENLKRAEQAQEALARVSRITAMGELTVSIAHEVNQPLMAIVTDAATCLRWLADDQLNISEARIAAERIIRHGHRAGDVIASIRSLARKAPPEECPLDLVEIVQEALVLARNEIDRHNISIETDFDCDDKVIGDRVQLQQVMLNLMLNGIEAIEESNHTERILSIKIIKSDELVQVTFADSGVGLARPHDEQIYEVFFTTKSEGLGIGLSICRTIIENHRGRLWATPNSPIGTAFHFTIPTVGAHDR